MKEKEGVVFSIGEDNAPIEGLTISRKVSEDNLVYLGSSIYVTINYDDNNETWQTQSIPNRRVYRSPEEHSRI